MDDKDIILKVNNLKKYFPIYEGIFRKIVGHVKAVDGVDFFIKKGETLGLVGESGCGKSTTGRCIVKLYDITSGQIEYNYQGDMWNLSSLNWREMSDILKNIQYIFQDPFSSLDSRMTVRDVISEPLDVQKIGTKKERYMKVAQMMKKVGLKAEMMNRYPHEFSGGQRQRIGVARSLALNPEIIICDEPVSALDVSVQAQVINLLSDLQKELELTYLFIAHDLSVVEHISDRVMVMYLGKIVETADYNDLYEKPGHPYTEALLAAIPIGDPSSPFKRLPLEGVVPDPSNPPSGCNFHTRCPYVKEICREEEPELIETGDDTDHFVACHFSRDLNLKGYKDRLYDNRCM